MKQIIVLLFAASCVLAQPQQSENFRIAKSVIDAGGGASASTDFRLVSAFGQPSPIGAQSSESFHLYAGFLSPVFAAGELNPIDDLVIRRQAGPTANVLLHWGRIAHAAQYKIYRSTDPLFVPGPSSQIGVVVDTSFTDVGALGLPAWRYYYAVTAANAAGLVVTPIRDMTAAAGAGQPPSESTRAPGHVPEVRPHRAAVKAVTGRQTR
ncbi:hypothetical protein HZB60_03665 [candidate division KSB1 bacterium]|nr:hypothetical protein [candidate division KSB1 bacterium]